MIGEPISVLKSMCLSSGFSAELICRLEIEWPASETQNPNEEGVITVDRWSALGIRSAGQPIGELMAYALHNPDIISLAAGFVDQESLPTELVLAACQRLMSMPQEGRRALQYGTTLGIPALRRHLLDAACDIDCAPSAYQQTTLDQVVVTAGSNQLLHLVAEVLLNPGDIVLCASPTYFVVLGSFAGLGADAYGVATDDQGVIPAALDETFAKFSRAGTLQRVKMVYLVSYFDNPCGITMPASRRMEILEIVRKWSKSGQIYLVDDAAYRDLRYDGSDVPSFRSYDGADDFVILAGTFSKCFSPGLRIGWGILPKELAHIVRHHKDNVDFGTSNLSQHILLTVLENGGLSQHIDQLRHVYAVKRNTIDEALRDVLAAVPGVRWRRPDGGLYVWLELPENCDTGTQSPLFNLAVREGILYVPGEYFYPPDGVTRRRNDIRLSFGVPTPDRLRLGVEALARALQSYLLDENR